MRAVETAIALLVVLHGIEQERNVYLNYSDETGSKYDISKGKYIYGICMSSTLMNLGRENSECIGPILGPLTGTRDLPGGPRGTTDLALLNGSFAIWNNRMYGWGNAATALCIYGNKTPGSQCQVSGTFGSDYGPAQYTSRPVVGLLAQVDGKAAVYGFRAGTFTSNRFNLTTPLTATEIANLRYDMVIDTNDATPFSGLVTGWDPAGAWVQVRGWYQQGPTNTTPGTPGGSAATISPQNSILAGNLIANIRSGDEANTGTGLEIDAYNSKTGAAVAGLNIVGGGTVGASQGVVLNGPFTNGYQLTGSASNGGFYCIPSAVGVCFFSRPPLGAEAWRHSAPSGAILGRIYSDSSGATFAAWGPQTGTAKNHTNYYYSSAGNTGAPDVTEVFSGGMTGTANKGIVTRTALRHIFVGQQFTQATTSPTVSSCGTSPAVSGSDNAGTITEGASGTGCKLTFSVAWPGVPSCVVTAQAGGSPAYQITTTTLTITNTSLRSAEKYNYRCDGQ